MCVPPSTAVCAAWAPTTSTYQLHRVDPDLPVEETWGVLAETVTAGTARHVGLSEVGVEQIKPGRPPGHHRAVRVLPVDPRRPGPRHSACRRTRRWTAASASAASAPPTNCRRTTSGGVCPGSGRTTCGPTPPSPPRSAQSPTASAPPPRRSPGPARRPGRARRSHPGRQDPDVPGRERGRRGRPAVRGRPRRPRRHPGPRRRPVLTLAVHTRRPGTTPARADEPFEGGPWEAEAPSREEAGPGVRPCDGRSLGPWESDGTSSGSRRPGARGRSPHCRPTGRRRRRGSPARDGRAAPRSAPPPASAGRLAPCGPNRSPWRGTAGHRFGAAPHQPRGGRRHRVTAAQPP
ncbi:aldo/keto reductase [Streptomyces olivaceoviridis]|uniref:aldo/keto reductase n=1 Tax=Streptomyces olivaceoviridis TaxID=1921 RepID=UPI003794EAA6